MASTLWSITRKKFMFRLDSIVPRYVFRRIIQIRSLYGVQHSARREIFYVRLDKNYEPAVLSYKSDGKILDMLSIGVPERYRGLGLARLLAEAAFTYAIIHDYYMILSCDYMQKLYLATKNAELEERVVGPKHILEFRRQAESDPESIHSLPDPDSDSSPRNS